MIGDVRNEMHFLHSIAWSFHVTTGMDFDELMGEAGVAFAEALDRYDVDRNTGLGTYAYAAVRNRLSDVTRKDVQRSGVMSTFPISAIRSLNVEGEDGEADLVNALRAYSTDVTPERIADLRNRIMNASTDARSLCRMIFKSPAEFMEIAAKKGGKGIIRQRLRKRGWSWPRIWSVFREMKELLA